MQHLIPSGTVDANFQVRTLVDDQSLEVFLTQILDKLHVVTQSYRDEERFFVGDGSGLPACVVVDWQTGSHDALDVSARCRKHWPQTAILLIAANPTVAFTVSAMRNGVDGVLGKPINPTDLITEIQTVIERSQSRYTAKHDRDDARRRISRLSDLELEILKFIADGIPNKNIALAMSLSLRTVEKYRHSLFETLEVTSAAEATRIWVLANLEN